MTARILCPDDHPDRWWRGDPAKRGEAFASINRALRDEVLPDPKVRRVIVMVGTAGAGKSTTAAELAKVDWQRTALTARADPPVLLGLEVGHVRCRGANGEDGLERLAHLSPGHASTCPHCQHPSSAMPSHPQSLGRRTACHRWLLGPRTVAIRASPSQSRSTQNEHGQPR